MLVSASGVLVVSLSYAAGREGHSWATVAYWGGHLLTFIPLAAYVLARRTRSKWVAVVGLALSQSLTKWMYSPLVFKFPDELQHRRTAIDILHYHALFHANPSLPVSPRFPGLEEITTSLMSITGLNLYTAGQIVAGLSHVALATGTFVLLRRVTRYAPVQAPPSSRSVSGFPKLRLCPDERVAAVSALIFAISPQNAFFNGLWIYEAPALVFMVVALIAATRRKSVAGLITAVICLAAVTVTHHVTAAITALTLLALGAGMVLQAGLPRRGVVAAERADGWRLLALGAVGAGLAAAWLIFVAPMTYQYLAGPVGDVLSGFLRAGSVGGKAQVGGAAVSPFTTAATVIGTGTMAVLVITGALLAWRGRQNALTRTFAVLGLGFFGLLGIRFLASDGAELAGRLLTYEYLFACVAASLALTQLWTRRRGLTTTVGLIAVVLVCVGNTTSGWPAPWELVPGKFKVDAFESGVDPAGVQAARWIAANLPRNAKVACDFTACSLVGGYGSQFAFADVPGIFYSRSFNLRTRELLSERGIDYVLVDKRIASQRPVGHDYFDHETSVQEAMTPLPPWALDKFDRDPRVHRVYDGGPLVVYDVRGLRGG
ncbi:MAG TPA: hypothetical protein VHW04_24945 [Solirubrobacteraceae bacterium]|jgi:hypothetical protein|nr:hypothetical protein [Solirubrobacteraceae bacterium]